MKTHPYQPMNPFVRLLTSLTLGFLASFAAPAADSDGLDTAWSAVVSFEPGQDAAPLNEVEAAVVAALDEPAARAELEAKLLRALDLARTPAAIDFLCRQLRTIGTERSVRALAALLRDPKGSHMARFALVAIGGPPAAQALEAALPEAPPALQVGILSSLGELGYCQAASPEIPRLLRSDDPTLAAAAADALGKLRDCRWAAEQLASARSTAAPALRRHIDNALLAAAEKLPAAGAEAEARRIYEFYAAAEQPVHLRIAALHGLVQLGGVEAWSRVAEAIRSADPALQASAVGLVRLSGTREATRAFAALAPELGESAQALLIAALGDRGDPAAAAALLAATFAENEAVRLAAIEALGKVGGADAVERLVALAATSEGALRRAARASLLRLGNAGVNAVLIAGITPMETAVRIERIRSLAARQAVEAIPAIQRAVRDSESTIRLAAIAALGELSDADGLGFLAETLVVPSEPAEREPVAEAIEAVFRRVPEARAKADPLLARFEDAPVGARPAFLRLLSLTGDSAALAPIRASLRAPIPVVADAAVRALAEWPDATPAADLWAVAQQTESRTHKALALRGYVRMASLSADSAAMYARAFDLADTVEDRRLVLAGLGAADSPAALELVEPWLKDADVRNEAALALVQIADKARRRDAARAKAALRLVIETQSEGPAANLAREVLSELEQYEGYLLVWQVAGPFQVKGKDSRVVFDTAFPVEDPAADGIEWRPLKEGIGSWDINLEATFLNLDQVAAYARTRVWSPREQAARIEAGSDDAIKIWLNGKLVHANYAQRSLSPRQDQATVNLREGWNDLLVKVVDHGGGWAFACRLRQPDGGALEDLKAEVPE